MNQNDAMETIRSLLDRWPGFLLNPRFKRVFNKISWETDDRRQWNDSLLKDEFEQLAKDRQYSFQLFDGSLVQLYYLFDREGATVTEAHLALIQPPRAESEEVTIIENIEDAGGVLIAERISCTQHPCPWIRIDFEPQYFDGCLHGNCHMHTSMSKDNRIPITGIPSPDQFVDAIAAWFYPSIFRRLHIFNKEFRDRRRMREISEQVLEGEADLVSGYVLHFRLPNVPAFGAAGEEA